VDGVSVFPKFLGKGLDIRRRERLISFAIEEDGISLAFEGARSARAKTVILALAVEQSLSLLTATPSIATELNTARALLGMCHSQPCLTVLALYGLGAATSGSPTAPPWHVLYPGDSRMLQAIVHDSSKRSAPTFLALVYQAHAQWSREHITDEHWEAPILAEAARLLGPWATSPALAQAHIWHYARNDLDAELAAPPLFHLKGGGRLGLVGDVFSPGGGAQAAFLSGQRLATRLLTEDTR
jgi:predicted NAD/FAD-dependent oxidoreductase